MSAHTATFQATSAQKHDVQALGELRNSGVMANVLLTGSASYDAGGSTWDLSSLFKNKITQVIFSTTDSKYVAKYVPAAAGDPATGKVKVFDINGNAEAGAVDLSAVEWQALVFGF